MGATEKVTILGIYRKYWMLLFGITLNFFITMALYPGVLLQGNIGFIHDDEWRVWFVIFLFTVMDALSRFISSSFMIKSPTLAGILTLIRLGMFATTLL